MFPERGEFALKIENLKAGEEIKYTGELIVMRDAAQKRLMETLDKNLELPVELKEKMVFYAGPAKTPSDRAIGAIGPTTSNRMDSFLEMLFKLGVTATIGKGKRGTLCRELCERFKRVYFVAPSGAAAALSKKVKSVEVLAYEDLGTEAIRKLTVEDFPLIVAVDSTGKDLFE